MGHISQQCPEPVSGEESGVRRYQCSTLCSGWVERRQGDFPAHRWVAVYEAYTELAEGLNELPRFVLR